MRLCGRSQHDAGPCPCQKLEKGAPCEKCKAKMAKRDAEAELTEVGAQRTMKLHKSCIARAVAELAVIELTLNLPTHPCRCTRFLFFMRLERTTIYTRV